MADEALDIVGTQRRLRTFAEAREWGRFHSPKNLVMALASETGELLDLFRWLTEDESRSLDDEVAAEVALELADVQIFLLRLADVLDISLTRAVEEKLVINDERYPIELSRDTATKYSRRPTADRATPPER
jgi:NTP pyrophosphatase (non-canonical NTP hydrolase)